MTVPDGQPAPSCAVELDQALKERLPLQIRIPNRRKPLVTDTRAVAEVFLVETTHGPAVVWLDPFWCGMPPEEACHIAYATPHPVAEAERWVDHNPRYGPRCLAYQKPFLLERLDRDSPAWHEYQTWQHWQARRPQHCGRAAAWVLVTATLGALIVARRV